MKLKDFTKQDVLDAIKLIDQNPGLKKGRESYIYDLEIDGKFYPPILVISEANKLAGGKELFLRDFSGNTKQAFKVLIELGFNVISKDGQMINVNRFLEVADLQITGKGTTMEATQYIFDSAKTYLGLNMKVSFGAGRATAIPWIAFTGFKQKIQNGIYPVLLYHKDHSKLILAYGVSAKNEPEFKWPNEKKLQTIGEYFKSIGITRFNKYDASFVYSVYETNQTIDEQRIETDLINLIAYYKKIFESDLSEEMDNEEPQKSFKSRNFIWTVNHTGLKFDDLKVNRFVASLLTKPFVILTGLSGSGKTKLAQAFARWICADKSQYCLVPVGADWTNREPLLGYPNALKTGEYNKPDNGILDLLIHAKDNKKLPHFLILDEMNLSHVERYFADFLSIMESNEEISLYSGKDRKASEEKVIPKAIGLPSNLFIIGTVNIDETTYMFSPKVLDRANVIEFRVSSDEILSFLEDPQAVDLEQLTGKGAGMSRSFLDMTFNKDFENNELPTLNGTLVEFFNELKKLGAEFGYRSANEIVRLINQLGVIDEDMDLDTKIDIAIMQKLLPKLHGSRRKLNPVLLKLGEFCLKDKIEKIETEVFGNDDFDKIKENVKYPITLEKLIRMHKGAIENGFASYAEA